MNTQFTTAARAAILVALVGAVSGCTSMIAGAMAVSTPDEIKRSSYAATMTSAKPIADVDGCLKQSMATLRASGFTYRDTGALPHQFMVSNNMQSTWSGARPELLTMAETTTASAAGTQVQVWAHPSLLSNGGSQGYLDRAVGAVRPCL